MQIPIHRVDSSLPLPQYATEGSFAFDLIARQDTTIMPRNIELIPSNIIIECPTDWALMILPRSSTPRKKMLVFPHSIGLIDADYCGEDDEIHIQVLNIGDTVVTVHRGERIAQGIFVRTERGGFFGICA